MNFRSKFLLIFLIIMFLLWLLMGCGPAYHLKKAKEKGAEITSDTIFRDLITERRVTDTIVKFQELRRLLIDTLVIETTRWKTRTKIDTVNNTIFQEVEIKPDTIRVETIINNEIKAGYTGLKLAGMIVFGLVVGLLVGFIIKSVKG